MTFPQIVRLNTNQKNLEREKKKYKKSVLNFKLLKKLMCVRVVK